LKITRLENMILDKEEKIIIIKVSELIYMKDWI